MIISVIFVLLFLAFLMGIILVPKIDGKINMIKVAVMGIMAIFCYQSFWAFMFSVRSLCSCPFSKTRERTLPSR